MTDQDTSNREESFIKSDKKRDSHQFPSKKKRDSHQFPSKVTRRGTVAKVLNRRAEGGDAWSHLKLGINGDILIFQEVLHPAPVRPLTS